MSCRRWPMYVLAPLPLLLCRIRGFSLRIYLGRGCQFDQLLAVLPRRRRVAKLSDIEWLVAQNAKTSLARQATNRQVEWRKSSGERPVYYLGLAHLLGCFHGSVDSATNAVSVTFYILIPWIKNICRLLLQLSAAIQWRLGWNVHLEDRTRTFPVDQTEQKYLLESTILCTCPCCFIFMAAMSRVKFKSWWRPQHGTHRYCFQRNTMHSSFLACVFVYHLRHVSLRTSPSIRIASFWRPQKQYN